MTLQTRPIEKSDAVQIVEIAVEAEALEPADQFFDVAEIDELLESTSVDLERGSFAVVDGDRLVGIGAIDVASPSEVWKGHMIGGVRTAYLEQGIGRRILTAMAEKARAIRDADAPGKPGELRLWAPERRPRTIRLAASLGYETWRYFQDMRHELIDLPPRTELDAMDGIEIRPWAVDLDEQTRLASNDSFADHWGSVAQDETHWREMFADASMFRPAVSMLALDDRGVVGFVLVEEFAAETAAKGYRTAYIARVGTARRGRGRGVASALLVEALHRAAADGYGAAELNVDSESGTGAGRIYERVGFVPTNLNLAMGIRF